MWELSYHEGLFNANMTLPLTKKDEEKVEDLSRRGTGVEQYTWKNVSLNANFYHNG
jgi:hypothetical protein